MTDVLGAFAAGVACGALGLAFLFMLALSLTPRDMPTVTTVVEDSEDEDLDDPEAEYVNELAILLWNGAIE